ncbi:MAG: phage/plasmid primase, P4 family [Gammaproteobacteria bacterium]
MNLEPKYPYTDYGNGQRFGFLFEGELMFIPEINKWYEYDNNIWKQIRIDRVHRLYQVMLDSIPQEIDLLSNEFVERHSVAISEERFLELRAGEEPKTPLEITYVELLKQMKTALKWMHRSQDNPRINAALDKGKSFGLMVDYKELDSKGYYLGTPTGIVNLRTKQIHNQDPSYLVTKSTKFNYNKDAECPIWTDYLLKMMKGDQEKADFLQRLFGQCLIGEPIKSHLVFFYGMGANGKSTIVDTVAEILNDYATSMKADVLTGSAGYSVDYHIAKLKGQRLALINEMNKNSGAIDAMVKSLVDSGEIVARQPYGEVFQFQPIATPIVNVNHLPPLEGTDEGIQRRILLVPFEYTIPKNERQSDYRKAVLMKEAEGILNWCIEGAYQLIQDKFDLKPPTSIQAYTETYLSEQDRIASFMDEYLVEDQSVRILWSEVYNSYRFWCEEAGMRSLGKIKCRQEFNSKGVVIQQGSPDNTNYVHGYNYRNKDVRGIKTVLRTDTRESIAAQCIDYDEPATNVVKFKESELVKDT